MNWTGVGTGRIKWDKGVAEGMSFKKYDKSIMTTNEQRREIAIESAKISCLHIK